MVQEAIGFCDQVSSDLENNSDLVPFQRWMEGVK